MKELINEYIYSFLGLAIFLVGLLISYLRKRPIKRLIEEILKDNNQFRDDTKIKINRKKIIIKNYKKLDTDIYQKLPRILEQETGVRYLFSRKNQKIILTKFLPFPKESGIYSQNINTGEIATFSLDRIKNWNGLLVTAGSGVGKSELVRSLIQNKNTVIYSPKGDEDFESGKPFDEEMILNLNHLVDNFKALDQETIIVIDEILTFSAILKRLDKKLLEKMSINFTLNRSSNLKWIIMAQKLNRISELDLSLFTHKIINSPDIGLFSQSLGVQPQTQMSNLKIGQFVLMREGEEYLIQYNMSKKRLTQIKLKISHQKTLIIKSSD